MSNSSIWAIDRTLSGATTSDWSGLAIDGNEEVLCIPQIFKAGASSSGCLVSYPGHSWKGSYPSTEMLLVYSTASASWFEFTSFTHTHTCVGVWSPHGMMANMLDCNIIVSEFELQPYYYIHFQTNTLWKGWLVEF